MKSLPPIKYVGSVKNVRGDANDGLLYFEFTDQYSVFDWGAMPDTIDDKGKALTLMADFFFRRLESPQDWKTWFEKLDPKLKKLELFESDTFKAILENGILHHSKGLVEVNKNKSLLAVTPIDVHPPKLVEKEGKSELDYSFYKDKGVGFLLPLEVIFRFGMPAGSSLQKRLKDKDYCEKLGLPETVNEGDLWDIPVIELSTKLEEEDRYISYEVAQDIAGLSENEFACLIETNKLLAMRLKSIWDEMGVTLWDGKFEFSLSHPINGEHRVFKLVDSIGPDELRLTYKEMILSKEFLRKFYRGSSWHEGTSKAKTLARTRGLQDWKKICLDEFGLKPKELPVDYKKMTSYIYTTLTNELFDQFDEKAPFGSEMKFDRLYENMQEL